MDDAPDPPDPPDPTDVSDPRILRVGDRVRFVGLPEEWNDPECVVHEESIEFMRTLIARGRPSRIARIDEWGYPWIDARVRAPDGVMEDHSWMISERSGWRRVRSRDAAN